MLKLIAISSCFFLGSQAALADDSEKLIGTWKLNSCTVQFQDGRASRSCAEIPVGYIILTAQGRMMGLLEDEARKPGKTDEEQAALYRTVFAYTGKYRLDGDKWITKVDAAWNPAWRGTEQVRSYKLEADLLQVTSAYAQSCTSAGGSSFDPRLGAGEVTPNRALNRTGRLMPSTWRALSRPAG